MRASYSTDQAAPAQRRQFWQDAVSKTYFPLDLRFGAGTEFNGSLGAWSLGPVAVSRNVSDGPFAEAKETVAGYFLLTVADEDEAIEIAKQCPALPYGMTVEIRPLLARCSASELAATKSALASA